MPSVYIDKSTGEYPITPADFRKRHPNVSVPKIPTDELIESFGYSRVFEVEKPLDRFVTEGYPEEGADGVWRMIWVTEDLTETEYQDRLERLKNEKRQEILDSYIEVVSVLAKNYPLVEVFTWDKQEAEARAWSRDNSAATPYIDSMALERGISREELISRIVANADEWGHISSTATGKKQRLIDALNAATGPAEVNAIVW